MGKLGWVNMVVVGGVLIKTTIQRLIHYFAAILLLLLLAPVPGDAVQGWRCTADQELCGSRQSCSLPGWLD